MTRHAPLLFAAGLVFRLAVLPFPGTIDTRVWKTWSAHAALHGLTTVYGPPDAEILRQARGTSRNVLAWIFAADFPRQKATWRGAANYVDYPPASLVLLWAVGKVYGLFHADMANSRLFNALINVPPLLASVAIVWLLRRSAPGDAGLRRALVFWLNPAVLLASALGYQDPVFMAFALGGVLALMQKRYVAAVALVSASCLVKPQGALVLPVFLVVLFHDAAFRVWLRAGLTAVGVAALVLLPWVVQGRALSALDGSLRTLTLTEPWVSAQGANLWWIVGYVVQWTREGAWPLARLLTYPEFHSWTGWDPRPLAWGLVAAATLVNLGCLLRARSSDSAIPLAASFQIHSYALLMTSVHENHTFALLVLAPLLLPVWDRSVPYLVLTSFALLANLFLLEGLGHGVLAAETLARVRLATGVDASLLAAGASIAAACLLLRAVGRSGYPSSTPPCSKR